MIGNVFSTMYGDIDIERFFHDEFLVPMSVSVNMIDGILIAPVKMYCGRNGTDAMYQYRNECSLFEIRNDEICVANESQVAQSNIVSSTIVWMLRSWSNESFAANMNLHKHVRN